MRPFRLTTLLMGVALSAFAAVQTSTLWQRGFTETSTAAGLPGILGLIARRTENGRVVRRLRKTPVRGSHAILGRSQVRPASSCVQTVPRHVETAKREHCHLRIPDVPAPPRATSTSDQVEKLAKGVDIIVHSTAHPIRAGSAFPQANYLSPKFDNRSWCNGQADRCEVSRAYASGSCSPSTCSSSTARTFGPSHYY
jgi:hypothetical protein